MTRSEKIWTWIAWRLPRGLVYWCAIRVMAHATTGEYSNQIVPELTAMDALKRWEKPREGDGAGPATRWGRIFGANLMKEGDGGIVLREGYGG